MPFGILLALQPTCHEMPAIPGARLVAIQGALDKLGDLLEHGCLVGLGPEHAVKGEALVLALRMQLHSLVVRRHVHRSPGVRLYPAKHPDLHANAPVSDASLSAITCPALFRQSMATIST